MTNQFLELDLLPHDMVPLINQCIKYGKYAKQLQDLIQTKNNQVSPGDDLDHIGEIKKFYDLLEDRFRKIHKNTRSNVQDCLTSLLHNFTSLHEISQELQVDFSNWTYWEEDCPICLQRIRLTSSANIQTSPCCRKLFHDECIHRHLYNSVQCPCCRYENLSSHPLYTIFKRITPDEAKAKFDNLTAIELRNRFLDSSSHVFRNIFNEWSLRNHQQQEGIYRDEIKLLRQEISKLQDVSRQ